MENNPQKGNGVVGLIIIIALIWSVSSLFSSNESQNSTSSYTANSYDAFNTEYVNTSDGNADTFRGYDCTDDCSGHEAGYKWAEENDITDEYDCDGNSNSFNEGCQAYIEEN